MPHSYHRSLFLSLLAFMLSGYLLAQTEGSADPGKDSLIRFVEMKYGLKQELFNGFPYYKHLIKYKGDPFYPDDSFYEGSVFIGGVDYDHLQLKYNCFSQFLVLEYTDFQGRYNQLSLNTAHIDSFRLEKELYQKLTLPGEKALYYQVIASGAVSCYIHWAKNIHVTSDDLQYTHEYTSPLATYYVSYRGDIQTFTKRKTFLSIFPESMAVEIKKYLRNQHFKLRETSPDDIQNLMNHIAELERTFSGH